MEIPFKKITWNEHEAALIIEVYEKVQSGLMPRCQAILQFSQRLRNRMILDGIAISDKYRNVADIDLQLNTIEQYMSDGENGFGQIYISKVFDKTLKLFKENRTTFEDLLNEANILYPEVENFKQYTEANDRTQIAVVSEQRQEYQRSKSITDSEIVDLLRESIFFYKTKPILGKDTSPVAYIKMITKVKPLVQRPLLERKRPNPQVKAILMNKFKMGYRMDSNMDRKRFANFYQSTYGLELDLDGVLLDNAIVECGIVYKDKLYIPELMLAEETQNDLFDLIKKQFLDNVQCIYYNVLFKTFNDSFLGLKILDASMLRSYLEYYDKNSEYHFYPQYFSKEADVIVDTNGEVINYIKEQGGSVSESEAISALPNIPEGKIHDAFNKNRDVLILSGRGQRFHIDNFQIEAEDRQIIINILTRDIDNMKFISAVELLKDLKTKAPRVIDNNSQFSDTGIRSALACIFGNLFSFRGAIISDKKAPISMQDAFIGFARGRNYFTLDELQTLADDFGTPINFDAVAIHNVRVSKELYVAKNIVSFDVPIIDNVIAMFCKSDFISITDINTYVAFPECGYIWNSFLLESYVYSFSRDFKLLHNRFNKTATAGAIVHRSAGYDDYNEVMAKALAKAGINTEKDSTVLDYFSENGFIGRRQLDSLGQVINRAKQLKTN